MRALPDVNVLLALTWSSHVHHPAATQWFQEDTGDGWATCLLTQSALLRLSMNPHVVGTTVDFSFAIEVLSELVAHPQHHFADKQLRWTDSLFDELKGNIKGYRQITDATLLGIAKQSGLQQVTFDQALTNLCPWPEHLRVLSSGWES